MANMKPIDSYVVQNAIKHAKIIRMCSDFHHFKIGAVIFDGHKILVGAANTNKTSPAQFHYNKYRNFDDLDPKAIRPCCHAEMAALTKLKNLYPDINTKKLSIFIYRQKADGSFALAKPCKACEQALREAGITSIYYTGDNSLCSEQYC